MTTSTLPQSYRELSTESLRAYLDERPIGALLGGHSSHWMIDERGDGNLNLVFMVEGADRTVIVKQALPYLRVVGESWPLTIERAHYEACALEIEGKLAPGLVPELLHADRTMGLTVMEYLSPHVIMRKGLVAGITYPHFAEQISTFLAKTLFFTSDLAISAAEKKGTMQRFIGNVELCKITEDLIFTDPYWTADSNRWNAPHLDAIAKEIRSCKDCKLAITQLKERFLNCPQALCHGDLHTGSIMITEADTRVIDPEFAFFGPIGFDVGMLLANLFMAYFSQAGHATATDDREEYAEWILMQIPSIWTRFTEKFLDLWDHHHAGDLAPARMLTDESEKQAIQNHYLNTIFSDAIGYCGAEMIRRILGLAHSEELESIADEGIRADRERRCLTLARRFLTVSTPYTTMEEVIDDARNLY